MDSRKALFAILGGVAFTTAIGILLSRSKNSSKGKKLVSKARDYANNAEETIKDSVADAKSRVKKMGKDVERMVNEGGNAK